MAMVYRKKRSKQYQQEGYQYALFVTNAFLLERIFAFAFDLCIMFLPIFLWGLCMLLMFVGLFPVTLLEPIQIATFALLIISCFTFNPILSVKSGGQTLGKYFYDLKVVNPKRKECAPIKLIAREIIGFSLPMLLLYLFFHIAGGIAYWGINLLFMLIHPMHISIIDLFLKTRIVVLKDAPKTKPTPKPQTAEVKTAVTPINKPTTTLDLHLHSNFSDDGQYNVEELFQLAAARGLRMISICDHNCVKANLIAKRMSELYHVAYVPGGEFDCRYQGMHLRILGYFMNSGEDIFVHLENESLKRERNASLRRVEAFHAHTGVEVDVDSLLEKNRYQKISGEMIAKQILENPALQDHWRFRPYVSGSRSDDPIGNMVKDFFDEGAPCYVEVYHPKLQDILDIIHLSGGVAVLSWAKEVYEQGEDVFADVIAQGIEGMEVFTPRYTNQDMAILLKAAKDHQLFVSCGSDFHGSHKPDIHIGETGCPLAANSLKTMRRIRSDESRFVRFQYHHMFGIGCEGDWYKKQEMIG